MQVELLVLAAALAFSFLHVASSPYSFSLPVLLCRIGCAGRRSFSAFFLSLWSSSIFPANCLSSDTRCQPAGWCKGVKGGGKARGQSKYTKTPHQRGFVHCFVSLVVSPPSFDKFFWLSFLSSLFPPFSCSPRHSIYGICRPRPASPLFPIFSAILAPLVACPQPHLRRRLLHPHLAFFCALMCFPVHHLSNV